MNRIDLNGQSAVVTGAAAGIGFAIALRLAQSGANVALWDIDQDAADKAAARIKSELGKPDQTILGLCADVRDAGAVSRAAGETLAALGGVEIAVNNAGISGVTVPTWDYPVEEWRQVIDVDLTGTFIVCRTLIPHMQKANYGRIVNIASVAGKEGNPNASAYSAAKAGVISLTKSLGKELATTGIAVNAVTPAAVKTAIFDQMTQAHVDFMLSKIPMQRFGEPGEIAAAVAWLASKECSFTTGAVLDLSGGRATY